MKVQQSTKEINHLINTPQIEVSFDRLHAGQPTLLNAHNEKSRRLWRILWCSPLPTAESGGRSRSRPGQSADWPARARLRKQSRGLDRERTADYTLTAKGEHPHLKPLFAAVPGACSAAFASCHITVPAPQSDLFLLFLCLYGCLAMA